jgi:hypothetical protein
MSEQVLAGLGGWMGSAEKQKRRERFFLDQFLGHQGISPTSIRQLDPPAPDFLIDFEGREVGIELTELFVRSGKSEVHSQPVDEPTLQAVESVTELIVSNAQKIYLDAGNPLVLATIVFSNRITIDQKRDQIAKQIAGKIQSMSLQNPHIVDWRSSADESEEEPLRESVAFIHTLKVPERRFARWTVARPGIVATLTPKHLQDSIDKKAKKINTYSKFAKEVWLLIVADRTRPSQKFIVPPNFPLDSLSSPFAKTFYYGYAAEELLQF